MEASRNVHTLPMTERIVRDIDTVLLAEEQLLEALKTAVKYNSLEPAEAEQVLFDFRHNHGLSDVQD